MTPAEFFSNKHEQIVANPDALDHFRDRPELAE